jgi:hypothetical protein
MPDNMKIDWKQTEHLLEKNIRFIENSKKIHTDITKLRHLNEEDYRIVPCEDGANITIEKKMDTGFIRMHSLYEPQREGQLLAEKRADEDEEGCLYIFIGLGFGYMYNYLMPKIESKNATVIIYEPSYDVFNYFIRLFDISAIFKGYTLRLFVNDNVKTFSKIFSYITDASKVRINKIFTMGYYNFFRGEVAECAEQATNYVGKDKINKDTKEAFAYDWSTNPVRNFPYIIKSPWYGGSKNMLGGKPAILVGAGPSLNKNAHLLKELQGKVFIMAVYASIKTLEKHGIRPDMYIALDTRQPVYTIDSDYRVEDIPFLLHCHVPPELFKTHKENNFILWQERGVLGIILRKLGKKIEMMPVHGVSVGIVAAEFLHYMGASTIVMLGMDLAFTGGQAHSKEYFNAQDKLSEEIDKKIMAIDAMQTTDVYGEKVPTNMLFSGFVRQFEEFAQKHSDTIELVDATEGGAKVNRTKIMSFREAIDIYMKEYTDSTYTRKLIDRARTDGKLFDEADREKSIKLFEKTIKQCKKIIELSKEAEELGEKIIKMFRFNRIPTMRELAKPGTKYNKLILEIAENDIAMDSVLPDYSNDYLEAVEARREDVHDVLFDVQTTKELIFNHKSTFRAFEIYLASTIEQLKSDKEATYAK